MRWISDGDGNYESPCGRMNISRRYHPWGSNPCVGWGVYVEGESSTAHLADSLAEAKAWADEEAQKRGWGHKLNWECRTTGHHEALLPDGALLVARFEQSGNSGGWQCHRKRGDDTRWVAAARYWHNLKCMVKEIGEDVYR